MSIKKAALRIAFFSCALLILGFLVTLKVPAKSTSEPRLKHSVCQAECVLDTNILHSGMGDTAAKNAYYGWYDTYYELTGCSQSGIQTIAEFTLSVIGELAGSPGGYTMQCWQGLMAQASLCSEDCSDYFISDAKYGPNMNVDLESGGAGALSVTLSNNDRGYLPEETPNGYSLQFNLMTTLQLDNGTALMVANTLMPSMSYSNWITRGGLDDCFNAYGEDDERCQIIAAFDMPNVIPADVDFLDGVLYDLTDQIIDSDGMGDSFSENGFVELFRNGESVTIEQGPYSGFYWTDIEGGADLITPWDASYGDVTIENHECNTWYCGIFGDRVDADTTVFALQGPEELRLPGTYTVSVTADLVHDKDFSNNSVSYSYTEIDVGEAQDNGDEEGEEEQSIPLEDLPIIDLPGTGEYPGSLTADLPGVMYRLVVPEDIYFLYVNLISLDGGQYSAFIERGSIPVPDYPNVYQAYECCAEGNASFSNGCPFTNPYPDSYYIFVPFTTSGSEFKLVVEWMTQSEAVTLVATHEATEQTQEETSIYTEVEPNDSKTTANLWDMQEPFTGQFASRRDEDYIQVNFEYSGIYTFTLSGFTATTHPVLMLLRCPTGGFLDRDSEMGEPISLTLDASAGEQYYFKIYTYKWDEDGSDYQLALTNFIPDPDESNDDADNATLWDIAEGDKQGYFYDKTTGRYDYYKFVATETQEGTEATFMVTNPGEDIRICLTLLNYRRYFLKHSPCSAAGEPSSLAYELEAGQEYYLKIDSLWRKVSMLPYTISVDYQPAEPEEDMGGQEFSIRGNVHDPWGVIKLPVTNAAIYIQVNGQPAFLLDTTNLIGKFKEKVNLHDGDEVRVWAVKEGLTFIPEEDVFFVDLEESSHRSVFIVVGELIQDTPTPEPDQTGTEPPPPIQTGLAITITQPMVTSTPTLTPTPSPLPTATPSPTPTIEIEDYSTTTIISGTIWRLFADSNPAGVAAAKVILSVNGMDQVIASSMIDGTYLITLEGIQPGDTLRLRAEGAEDVFEPAYYEWQAEAGVDKWDYEFYSYWDEISAPWQTDENRIFGWVLDNSGHGIAGVYLKLQMGNSDAIQRLGPTNANGYYEGFVTLPCRMMVTIWVDGDGFLPSQQQFFHAYDLENREINFRQESVGTH